MTKNAQATTIYLQNVHINNIQIIIVITVLDLGSNCWAPMSSSATNGHLVNSRGPSLQNTSIPGLQQSLLRRESTRNETVLLHTGITSSSSFSSSLPSPVRSRMQLGKRLQQQQQAVERNLKEEAQR